MRDKASAFAWFVLVFGVECGKHLEIPDAHLYNAKAFDPAVFDHSRILEEGDNDDQVVMYMYWKVNEEAKMIDIAIDVYNVSGWISVGVSPSGGMAGSDIWVLRKEEEEFRLEDRFATTYTLPVIDSRQETALIAVHEEDSEDGKHVSFHFSRVLESCGGSAELSREIYKQQDLTIRTYGVQPIIWAWSQNQDFIYHGKKSRGLQALHSWSAVEYGDPEPNEWVLLAEKEGKILDAVNGPYEIPTKETTYIDSYFEVPKGNWVVVGISDIHESGRATKRFIHHTLLYGCTLKLEPSGPSEERKDKGACVEILVLPSELLPPGTKGGVIIGDEGDIKSLRVEVHYENIRESPGVIDKATGYRLHLLPNDGTYTEIGTITTGTLGIAIPPHTPKGSEQSEVWGECTLRDDAVPKEGINVLFNAWHMHLTGRSMWTQVIRDGKEILELGRSNYYDWNHQGTDGMVAPGTKLYAGDRIVVHCIFDTKERDVLTSYGDGTNDEMCFDFILYYPRDPKLKQCFGVTGGGGSNYTAPSGPAVATDAPLPETIVGSSVCPERFVGGCSQYSSCFAHSEETCNPTTGEITAESCAAARFCKACYPNSACGVASTADDAPPAVQDVGVRGEAGTLVHSPVCPPTLSESCQIASWCYANGCNAETAEISCNDGAKTCMTCFPYSPCANMTLASYQALPTPVPAVCPENDVISTLAASESKTVANKMPARDALQGYEESAAPVTHHATWANIQAMCAIASLALLL